MLSGWAKSIALEFDGKRRHHSSSPRSSLPSILSTQNWLEKIWCILWCGNFTWEETVYAIIAAAIRVVSFPGRCKCRKADCSYYHVTCLYDYPGVEMLVGNEIGRLADFERVLPMKPTTNPWQYFNTNYAILWVEFHTPVWQSSVQHCYFKRDRPLHGLENKSRERTEVCK